jgi:hypothetical protein
LGDGVGSGLCIGHTFIVSYGKLATGLSAQYYRSQCAEVKSGYSVVGSVFVASGALRALTGNATGVSTMVTTNELSSVQVGVNGDTA